MVISTIMFLSWWYGFHKWNSGKMIRKVCYCTLVMKSHYLIHSSDDKPSKLFRINMSQDNGMFTCQWWKAFSFGSKISDGLSSKIANDENISSPTLNYKDDNLQGVWKWYEISSDNWRINVTKPTWNLVGTGWDIHTTDYTIVGDFECTYWY